MLTIPWLNPKVTNFGDVNGDGENEDLSTVEGRCTVVRWYIDEARRRFADAGYRNLELWGFYRMREDIADDSDTNSMIAQEVHSRGDKLLWIPYFMARGWDKWQEYGFDVAIMQPNYAFRSWMDGGRARRNRLAATADMARAHGLGVEIEVRGNASSDFERRMFLQYLCDGAKSRYGYQDVPTAYYLDVDAVGALYRAKDARSRETYDALCDYVVGKPVKDPDQKYTWKWAKSKDGLIASAALPDRHSVSSVDVYLEDGFNDFWRGIVSADVRVNNEAKWRPCGWTIRGNVVSIDGMHQVIAVPVNAAAAEVRIVFRPEPGSPALDVSGISVEFEGPSKLKHLALDRGYTFSPARSAAPYGDEGGKLTDGVISTTGSLVDGKNVGWQLYEDRTSIVFDLGKSVPVSSIEMYTWGGGIYSINWPVGPIAALSDDHPIYGFSGTGAYPYGVRMLAGSQPTVDRRRSDNDMDGRIIFSAAKPISARYVTILTGGQGWVMCSEVRILSNGMNVLSKNTPYTVKPLPSYGSDVKYADDGAILTDGLIATDFEPSMLAGWQDDGVREIVVDLGKVQDLHKLTAWSLGGGAYGIHAPKSVIFSVSTDGKAWSPSGMAPAGVQPKADTCGVLPYVLDLKTGVRGRYVRVSAIRSQGWAMLSEVSVQ
jgi:hypothetical protein